MKTALFQLRSIIIVTFIVTFVCACAEGNNAPVTSSGPVAAESAEPAVPPAVSDSQSAPRGSAETPQQPSTSFDGATDRHFECATQADVNATIAVTTDTSIDGNLVLEPGDEIAIFTPNSDICAGTAVWNGENIAITAWGDDSRTEEIDGLVNGDQMLFRIWDASEQIAYQATGVDYQEGDGIFIVDGIYIVAALTIEEQ